MSEAADDDERLISQVRAELQEKLASIDPMRRQLRRLKVFFLTGAVLACIGIMITVAWYWFADYTVSYESAEYDNGRRTTIIWLTEAPNFELPRVHRRYELAKVPSPSLEEVTCSPDGREVYLKLRVPFKHRASDDQTVFAIRSQHR